MMAKRVFRPGDVLTASDINALVTGVHGARDLTGHRGMAGVNAPGSQAFTVRDQQRVFGPHAVGVRVYNEGNYDLPPFGPVQLLTDVSIDDLLTTSVVNGQSPDRAILGRFGVAAEAIAAGSVGWCWVSGVCIAAITFATETQLARRCMIGADGVTNKDTCTAWPTGAAKILGHNVTVPGDGYALIQLGDALANYVTILNASGETMPAGGAGVIADSASPDVVEVSKPTERDQRPVVIACDDIPDTYYGLGVVQGPVASVRTPGVAGCDAGVQHWRRYGTLESSWDLVSTEGGPVFELGGCDAAASYFFVDGGHGPGGLFGDGDGTTTAKMLPIDLGGLYIGGFPDTWDRYDQGVYRGVEFEFVTRILWNIRTPGQNPPVADGYAIRRAKFTHWGILQEVSDEELREYNEGDPTVEATNAGPTEPTVGVTEPTLGPTEPTGQYTEATAGVTEPTEEATLPSLQPTLEATDATACPTGPTQGSTVPTVGATEATVAGTVPTHEPTVPTIGSTVATPGSTVPTEGSTVATPGSTVATPGTPPTLRVTIGAGACATPTATAGCPDACPGCANPPHEIVVLLANCGDADCDGTYVCEWVGNPGSCSWEGVTNGVTLFLEFVEVPMADPEWSITVFGGTCSQSITPVPATNCNTWAQATLLGCDVTIVPDPTCTPAGS